MHESMALLGLNEYEARVYRALLAESPATAYRLGRLSGVPLSRVYDVAARLVEKGAAILLPGQPSRYAPADPEALVSAARRRTERALSALARELAALRHAGGRGSTEVLRGEDAVRERVDTLISSARRELIVAAGPATVLRSLTPGSRAVTVRVGRFGADHELLVLADGHTLLAGILGPDAEAVVTCQPALCRLVQAHFPPSGQPGTAPVHPASSATRPSDIRAGADWIGWEAEKQRRLLRMH